MRASTVGPAILYPFRCRMGSTAPSRAGFRNLFECQLPASGPVSASPSPTTQHDDEVRIVEDRAVGVQQRIPQLAALVN